jgi:hypothetical protein
MKYLLFFLLLIAYGPAPGQELVFVNTPKLVLRDRPEKEYNVFAILLATCPLKLERYDAGYENDPAVKERFYRVSFTYQDNKQRNHLIFGWVVKKYVVPAFDEVSVPGADKSDVKDIRELMYPVELRHDGKFNASMYPPPEYKGGEKQPEPVKREFHRGPRGGCYYLDKKGRKVYVDKSNCSGK